MGLFGGAKRELIGVDIGSYAIKAAYVAPGRSGPELVALASIRTPPGAIEDGIVTDVAATAAALRELLDAAGLTVRDAATAVGGPRVIARPQTFPHMSEARLRQTALYEAEKFIAFSLEESIVEPQIVAERQTEDGRMLDVMVVAAQTQLVDSRVQVLQRAGLSPVFVDIEAFALLRSMIYGTHDPDVLQSNVGIVRLGESYGDITIVASGSYVLYRTLPGAGRALTEAIATQLGVTYHEAEAIKETDAVAVTPDVAGALDERSARVSEAIQPVLDDLTYELRLSLGFFQAQFQDVSEGGTVRHLLLTGGTSVMRNLDRYLSAAVGVPVSRRQFIDSLALDRSRFDPAYLAAASPLAGVAVGLTLTNHMKSGSYAFAADPSQFGVALQRRQQ